jgi:hypothetical protein
MSSVFDRFRNPQLNMIKEAQRLAHNPSQVADIMLNNGKITKEQYNQLKNMNNPKDMCIYLMGQNEQFKQAVETMRTLQS